MPLETGTYISDFNASNPAHSDALSQADSHMRWIKSAILATFTGITGVVSATHTQLNAAVAAVVTGTAQALHQAGSLGAPGVSFISNAACGLMATGTNALALVTNGVAAISISAAQAVGVPGTLTAGTYAGGSGQLLPVGLPLPWLSDTLPSPGNFIWLNGQAISRTGNPILFTMWGTKYGAGDGSTTFNVPDLRNLGLVGKGTMGGTSDRGLISNTTWPSSDTTGNWIGEGAHTLLQAELPNVNFTVSGITLHDPGHVHLNQGENWAQNQGGGAGGGGAGQPFMAPGTSGANNFNTNSATTGITVQTQGSAASGGSGTAHNVVQPSMVCNWVCLAA